MPKHIRKPNPQTSDTSHTNLIKENTAKNMYLTRRKYLKFTQQLGQYSNNTYKYLLSEKIGNALINKK